MKTRVALFAVLSNMEFYGTEIGEGMRREKQVVTTRGTFNVTPSKEPSGECEHVWS